MDTNTYILGGVTDSPSIPNLTQYKEIDFGSNSFASGDQMFPDESPEDTADGASVDLSNLSSLGE